MVHDGHVELEAHDSLRLFRIASPWFGGQLLSGYHKRAVVALSFSPDGRHLASLGCDDDHSIAIYDWRNSLLKVSAECRLASVNSLVAPNLCYY